MADSVPSGALVSVTKGGRVIIILPTGTIFTVYGGSELELLLSTMRTGVLKLLAGAVLMVVPRGMNYLMAGLATSIGIKGTVVYRQKFGAADRIARTREGMVRIPEGISEYVCTCHGETEYVKTGKHAPYFRDRSDYHHAFSIDPSSPGLLRKAPQLDDMDAAIRALVGLQEGAKHDIGWLRY